MLPPTSSPAFTPILIGMDWRRRLIRHQRQRKNTRNFYSTPKKAAFLKFIALILSILFFLNSLSKGCRNKLFRIFSVMYLNILCERTFAAIGGRFTQDSQN